MSEAASPATGTSAPTGLAALVTRDDVRALLTARAPDLLERSETQALFDRIRAGVAAEVEQITGPIAPGSPLVPLATWCLTLGIAANIESSLFPEQQLGDGALAGQLQARYLGVRAQLQQAVNAGTGGPDGAGPGAGPHRGGFTAPPGYWPDAAANPWAGRRAGDTEPGWVPVAGGSWRGDVFGDRWW